MIDLNEFTAVHDRNRFGLEDQSYLKATTDGLYLKVDRTHRKQFNDLYGHKCNVYISQDCQRIILAMGDARTFSTCGADGSGMVSLASLKKTVFKELGTFDRFHFDVRWDEDKDGHKLLVFTHNGKARR